jgi:toxin ParE1/3/4
MRVILKRPRAADDLIELWDYIAEDSVTRADAFIDDVDAKFQLLVEQPMSG